MAEVAKAIPLPPRCWQDGHREGAGPSVLRTEGRVALVDAILAIAVLADQALNAGLGW
jgi:hypothetical protein